MRNFIQPGRTVDLTAPSGGVVAGNGYKIGSFIGFAGTSAAQGLPFALHVEGIYDATAEGAGSGQDLAEGDTVYWDNTNKRMTKTASGNTKAGLCCAAKATTATVVRVKLQPQVA